MLIAAHRTDVDIPRDLVPSGARAHSTSRGAWRHALGVLVPRSTSGHVSGDEAGITSGFAITCGANTGAGTVKEKHESTRQTSRLTDTGACFGSGGR